MAPTRTEIDRILCPVDFSEFSTPAVERAVRLGRWFEARVEVIHVVPFVVPTGLPDFPVPLELTHQVTRKLADLVAPFLGPVPIETKLLEGEPWRVIREEAEAWSADLLVMGTHGRGGFEHLLLGSVTEKLMGRAPCPVLTVGHVPPHPTAGAPFRRILCAADLTHASERTLDVALSLASEDDGHITLLHVVESLPGETAGRLYLAVPEIGPLRRDVMEQARTQLRKAVPDAARDFCRVSERVEAGAAWREILRVADETDADLIVMGAHARSALGRMFFGSTASHVVRRAACPVLIVQERKSVRSTPETAEAVGAVADRPKGGGR
jgi:nucleotide-binding universal stress UspA family protein